MSQLRFSVLGPVRAWRDGDELDLGSPQQQAVLSVLLSAEGRQVPLSALIDALWADDPPRAAAGTVRTYVSRLRRSLGAAADGSRPDVIESAGDGYLLPLRGAVLDLNLFLHHTRAAQAARGRNDAAQAAALLRDALGLYQGVPLAGVPGGYASAQRSRLAELQLAAVEDRLALDIELGRHVAAAADLQSLLAAHPLRERLSELLMLALYRSGRQARALAVFDDARRLLREELGLDPGPGLRDMHQRILQSSDGLIRAAGTDPEQEPAAAGTGPEGAAAAGGTGSGGLPLALVRPAQLPADLSAFTGRDAELAELDALLDSSGQAAPAVVIGVINGMAGIGKTTLAVHWAHRAAVHFPDGQLQVNLRGFDPSGAVMAPGEALRGFLEALGVPPQRIPDGLEAQAGLYRSLLSDRRVLIVLDNARDVAQVRPLLPGSPGCLVLITSRSQLTGLITTHDARSLSVDPFSADDTREALTRRLGSGWRGRAGRADRGGRAVCGTAAGHGHHRSPGPGAPAAADDRNRQRAPRHPYPAERAERGRHRDRCPRCVLLVLPAAQPGRRTAVPAACGAQRAGLPGGGGGQPGGPAARRGTAIAARAERRAPDHRAAPGPVHLARPDPALRRGAERGGSTPPTTGTPRSAACSTITCTPHTRPRCCCGRTSCRPRLPQPGPA